MKPLTIQQLKDECEKQIKLGHGDNVIMISQDDEGNGYHYLWYSFSPTKDLISKEEINEEIVKFENTIILG